MPNLSGGNLSSQFVASLALVAILTWAIAWVLPIIVRALQTGVIEGRNGFYDRRENGGMFTLTLGVFVFMALLFLLGLTVMVSSFFSGAP